MKIALICSHGGHLTEMMYLIDAFKDHDIFFVTYDNIRTRNLEYRKYLFPNFGEKPYKMFLNLHKIINIFLKEKPDVIISNGAEIAIPFFYLGKILGIKTIFIECYTRIDTPTITGKLVYHVSNSFLVLWPEMLSKYGKKAEYLGGMFNVSESNMAEKSNESTILVITGMHSGFDRLVKKIDEIALHINEKFIIQSGNAQYTPENAEYFKFKSYEEIKELIKDSKIVICQGAMTSIDALALGVPVIIIPRSKEKGEVINDHQSDFANKLEEIGLVRVLKDLNFIERSIADFSLSVKQIQVNTDLVFNLRSSIKQK
jgi:beta-1,4-N-acetylglucosaminyltransferase